MDEEGEEDVFEAGVKRAGRRAVLAPRSVGSCVCAATWRGAVCSRGAGGGRERREDDTFTFLLVSFFVAIRSDSQVRLGWIGRELVLFDEAQA